MAFAVADPYPQVIRSGSYALTYTVDASLSGVPVAGATGLAPTGGSITDTTKPGVRRLLNLELAPQDGLFDALSPIGTQLKVTAHVRYQDGTTVDIPMGVFDVDSERISEGGGALSLTAPDKWARIQRARFLLPQSANVGWGVSDQIAALIRGAVGASETVRDLTTASAFMKTMTWDRDRDKAITDLAASIGAWVYFDRNGVATIADVPSASKSADWLIDSSPSGVLTSLDRERSRGNTYNVVMISSSATTPAFPAQIVWDNDPASPTFAGATDPIQNPGPPTPFGIVPYFYESPLFTIPDQARKAGFKILARVTGLASQVSLGSVPNPAVDAFDALDILPPGPPVPIVQVVNGKARITGWGTQGRILERHLADTVTHPLTVGAEQTIEGRSTRTDEFS